MRAVVYTLDTATGALVGRGDAHGQPARSHGAVHGAVGHALRRRTSVPLDNQLRVQSDTGQNLRVDVDAGTVITDGALNPGHAAGGRHRVLEQLCGRGDDDAVRARPGVAASLVRQTSISGALTTVGTRFNAGTTFALEGGFDIAGGDNGLSDRRAAARRARRSRRCIASTLGNGALTSLGLLGTEHDRDQGAGDPPAVDSDSGAAAGSRRRPSHVQTKVRRRFAAPAAERVCDLGPRARIRGDANLRETA